MTFEAHGIATGLGGSPGGFVFLWGFIGFFLFVRRLFADFLAKLHRTGIDEMIGKVIPIAGDIVFDPDLTCGAILAFALEFATFHGAFNFSHLYFSSFIILYPRLLGFAVSLGVTSSFGLAVGFTGFIFYDAGTAQI